MEYISAEEFLKQPEDVRKVFLDWWKPEMYDLSFKNYGDNKNNFLKGIYKGCIQDNEVLRTVSNKELMYYPLLTEGQLRKFIEDKTNKKLVLDYYKENGYRIVLYKSNIRHSEIIEGDYYGLGRDLLRAYWRVALEIAKGE